MSATAQTFGNATYVGRTWIVRILPSLTDLVFLLPLFVLFCLSNGARRLLVDADLGWHLKTGEWILQHHSVPVSDLFSFTKAGAPWFAWEWAWDASFALVHRAFGLPGVLTVNVVMLGLVSALTFRLARRQCGNAVIALGLTIVAVVASFLHWLARPHLLSWVLFLASAYLVAIAESGRKRCLIWLPALMIIWANVHGSFVLGLCLVLVPAVTPWIEYGIAGSNARAAAGQSRPFLLCALACGLATFINPYGWHLHQHVFAYLHDAKQMDAIQEFQSISFHHPPAFLIEIMLLLGGACVFWCVQTRRWTGALMLVFWGHLALFSARGVPIFLFLATPWIASMLSDVSARSKNPLMRRAFQKLHDISAEFEPLERVERLYVFSALFVLFVFLSLAANRAGFEASFDPQRFPQSALTVIDREHAKRIFATDQWSDYLLYERWPTIRVFADARSDFYGADMIDRILHILNARWDWEADLLRYSVDMVIVAPDTPLATVLKGSPRWKLVLDDKSVLAFIANGNSGQFSQEVERNKTFSAVASNGGSGLETPKRLQVWE